MKALRSSMVPAFSLVEVAVALGIVSFVLLALMGLAIAGLDASRTSQDDTTLAALAREILVELKSNQQYDELSVIGTSRRHWNSHGEITDNPDEFHYQCDITVSPPGPAIPGVSSQASQLLLRFTWPYGQSPPQNEQVFTTTLAAY